MNVTYRIIEEQYEPEHLTYGIAAYADGASTALCSLHDITTDREKLSRLIAYCNRLALSPLHLADVVDDFLAE